MRWGSDTASGKQKKRRRKNRLRSVWLRGLFLLAAVLAFFPVLAYLTDSGVLPGVLREPAQRLLSYIGWGDGAVDGRDREIGGEEVRGALAPLPADPSGYFVMDCLDVGQADCTLLRQGEHAMLFDCGAEDPETILRFLREEDVSSLDMVWLSHGDADHISAIDEVIAALPVKLVLVNSWMEGKDTVSYERYEAYTSGYQIPVAAASAGESWWLGDALLTVLGPLRYDSEEPNNNSLVVRAEYGDTSVLLCGDAQAEEEADLVAEAGLLHADVLHVGHHGSNTSSTQRFLALVRPTWAVISCGRDNDYGHPGRYAQERLQKAGASILRTDQEGTVRFLSDGNRFSVSAIGL